MNDMSTNIREIDIYKLSSMPLDQIVSLYNQGYRLNEGFSGRDIKSTGTGIRSLATCNASTKTVGQVISMSAVPTGGTPPYTVNFYKDGVKIDSKSISSSGQTATSQYTLTSGDVGTHTFSSDAVDSCSTGAKTSSPDSCSVTVQSAAPPPSQCNPISNVSLTCPSGAIASGQNSWTVNWSGGTSPYRLILYLDGSTSGFYDSGGTPNITGTSTTVSVYQGMTAGSHNIQAQIIDSCSPQQVKVSNVCTVTVGAAPPPTRYRCDGAPDYLCIQDPNGAYPDLASCQNVCKQPPPTPTAGYNCISPGNCQYVSSGAQYPDSASCQNACKAAPPPGGGGGGFGACSPACTVDQYCIMGTCVPKTYITYGAIGFGALFLLSILK